MSYFGFDYTYPISSVPQWNSFGTILPPFSFGNNYTSPINSIFTPNDFGYFPDMNYFGFGNNLSLLGNKPQNGIFGFLNTITTPNVLTSTQNGGMFNFLYATRPTASKNVGSTTSAIHNTNTNLVSLKNVGSITSNTNNTNTNLVTLKKVGYNSLKGQKLASIAQNNTVGFTGHCAHYVKDDISQAGLGKLGSGDAFQMPDLLKNNNNFKEISTVGLNLENLPAGCILVYNKGVSGYSQQYGHTEITLGNGNAVSDGITHNIRQGARVFVPV